MSSAIITITQGDFLYILSMINKNFPINEYTFLLTYNFDKLPKYDYVRYFDISTNNKYEMFDNFSGKGKNNMTWPELSNKISNLLFNEIKIFFKKYIKYVAYIDTDEFITPLENFNNITEYLDSIYNQTLESEYIKMEFISDNNLIYYENKPVLERFNSKGIIIEEDVKDYYKKSIINIQHKNIDLLKIYSFHGTSYSKLENTLPTNKIILKHFFTKSLEEWIMKMNPKNDKDYFERFKSELFDKKTFFKFNQMTEEKIKAIPELLKKYNIDYNPIVEEKDPEFKNLYQKMHNPYKDINKIKVALVCCGRLENRYAVEFVEYYKNLGFDHIYICDNNYDGEEYFEDVLQSYIDDKFVTIKDYRNQKVVLPTSYQKEYDNIKDNYDWVAFLDFDEFLTLVEDNNIKEYLSRGYFHNYNQILINWKTYGDNDLVYDDGRPCLERFTMPIPIVKKVKFKDIYENMHCKSIIRTKLDNINIGIHCSTGNLLNELTCNNVGYKINASPCHEFNYKLAYIKHFATKTLEEYLNTKYIRGTGADFKKFNKYPLELFFKYNNLDVNKLDYIKNKGIDTSNLTQEKIDNWWLNTDTFD